LTISSKAAVLTKPEYKANIILDPLLLHGGAVPWYPDAFILFVHLSRARARMKDSGF